MFSVAYGKLITVFFSLMLLLFDFCFLFSSPLHTSFDLILIYCILLFYYTVVVIVVVVYDVDDVSYLSSNIIPNHSNSNANVNANFYLIEFVQSVCRQIGDKIRVMAAANYKSTEMNLA